MASRLSGVATASMGKFDRKLQVCASTMTQQLLHGPVAGLIVTLAGLVASSSMPIAQPLTTQQSSQGPAADLRVIGGVCWLEV